MGELDGKVALVTGASRGIGRAVAVALARAGCDVAVNYRERGDDAEETARLVEAEGRRALVVRADVADAGQVARLAGEVSGALGPVGVLVNNAGVARPKALDALTVDDFDAEVAVNLRSAFLVTQAFLPAMRSQRWGRIVFVSSVAAQVGGVVGPHYAASKAGMHGLAHAYASLLAGEGVTANVVAPALIETEMVTNNPRARPGLIPVGRFGRVEEVADLVVAVAGNGYVTGQTINVNGGWYFS
jgi:3-oxoacyl-[acyl-carrier protein] reductase